MKKVSIIVPVYNVENYLEESIYSIINQSFHNTEIILVDDGSTDNSGNICDEFAKKDSRIIVIHQENQGAAVAKNNALDIMTGDYFIFVDSDDWIEATQIEKSLLALEQNDAEMVVFGFFNEFLSGNELVPINNYKPSYTSIEYMKKLCVDWTCSMLCNKMFSKNILENIRFKEERRAIDDEFFVYKLVLNANKIVELNECFYHYRIRKSSVTKSENLIIQRRIDRIDFITERYYYVKNLNGDLAKNVLNHLIDIYVQIISYYDLNNCIKSTIKNNIKRLIIPILKSSSNYRNKIKVFLFLINLRFGLRKEEGSLGKEECYD